MFRNHWTTDATAPFSSHWDKLKQRPPIVRCVNSHVCMLQARYDDYVAALLDSPIGKHKVLSDQMEQISSGIGYNMKQLQEEMTRLAQMEAEGKAVLLINDRQVAQRGSIGVGWLASAVEPGIGHSITITLLKKKIITLFSHFILPWSIGKFVKAG